MTTDLFVLAQNGPQLGSGYDWFMLISRIVHMVSAIVLVGGLFYLAKVVTPAAASAGTEPGDQYFGGRRAVWAMWVGVASGLLLATGFWNYIQFSRTFELAKSYHMMLGIKMLVGIALMFIAALIAGRSALAQKMRQRWLLWLNVCLLLGVITVALGSVLRTYPRPLKVDAPAAPQLIAP